MIYFFLQVQIAYNTTSFSFRFLLSPSLSNISVTFWPSILQLYCSLLILLYWGIDYICRYWVLKQYFSMLHAQQGQKPPYIIPRSIFQKNQRSIVQKNQRETWMLKFKFQIIKSTQSSPAACIFFILNKGSTQSPLLAKQYG